MEKFVHNQEPEIDELKGAIRNAVIKFGYVPVFCGSSFRNIGVQPLIDGICEYQYKSIYEDPDAVKNRADILRELITLDKAYNIVESPPKTWIYDMPSLIKLFGTALILIYPVIVDFILNKIISIPCT